MNETVVMRREISVIGAQTLVLHALNVVVRNP